MVYMLSLCLSQGRQREDCLALPTHTISLKMAGQHGHFPSPLEVVSGATWRKIACLDVADVKTLRSVLSLLYMRPHPCCFPYYGVVRDPTVEMNFAGMNWNNVGYTKALTSQPAQWL